MAQTYQQTQQVPQAIYWSSTEASIGNAYSQYSNDGYPPNGGYYKNTTHNVRAVRDF